MKQSKSALAFHNYSANKNIWSASRSQTYIKHKSVQDLANATGILQIHNNLIFLPDIEYKNCPTTIITNNDGWMTRCYIEIQGQTFVLPVYIKHIVKALEAQKVYPFTLDFRLEKHGQQIHAIEL